MSCPTLTDKDRELLSKFRGDIEGIHSESDILLSQCQRGGGQSSKLTGGTREKYINLLVKIIVMAITAGMAGASAAFFLTAIPEAWQIQIISLVNLEAAPLSVCSSTTDYALGMAIGVVNQRFSCSYRAQMLEQALNRIATGVGALAGLSMGALENNIRGYITQRIQGPTTTYSIQNGEKTNPYYIGNKGGRRRKSRRGKRKQNKSRKLRRSKKY